MTASPVGSVKRLASIMADLEEMLDAQICAPDPDSTFSDFVVKPEEWICWYDTANDSQKLPTQYDELANLLVPIKSTKRFCSNASYAGFVPPLEHGAYLMSQRIN